MTNNLFLKTRNLMIFGIFFLILIFGAFIGSLITFNLSRNFEEKPVYLFNPSEHAKFSVIPIEKEPNDTFNNATSIKPGYLTQGTFGSLNDIDVYSFNVDTPSDVEVILQNLPKEYNMFIYDKNKVLIASSLHAGFSESSSVISLNDSGKYYVKLAAKGSTKNNNNPYTILLNILPFTE